MNDAIVERIRKLLTRTSEAGCSQAEAEIAFAKASKLLAEHNLSMDEINSPVSEWVEEEAMQSGRFLMEHTFAYAIVSKFFFVKGLSRSMPLPGKPRNSSFILFGKKENVETARFIYTSLLSAFDRLFESAKMIHGFPQKERRNFIAGVYKGFFDKLTDERKIMTVERDAVNQDGQKGTAIALVSLNKELDNKFSEQYTNLRKSASSYSSPQGSRSSYDAGYASGKNLNLNRGLSGDKRKKLGQS